MDEKQRRNIIRKIREKSDKISMRWQAAMAGLPPPLLSGVASSTVPAAPAAGVKVATAKEPTPPSKPPLPPDLFCDTIRNWVETLTSQLSGIERIRCLHDPARDKAVVIFGERHGVKEAGKQSLKESFIHLLHILKPAKVDLMVEMREWKRRNKERKSFGVTEIQKVRDWPTIASTMKRTKKTLSCQSPVLPTSAFPGWTHMVIRTSPNPYLMPRTRARLRAGGLLMYENELKPLMIFSHI